MPNDLYTIKVKDLLRNYNILPDLSKCVNQFKDYELSNLYLKINTNKFENFNPEYCEARNRHKKLIEENKLSSGSKTAILCSSADGSNNYSSSNRIGHIWIGKRYRNLIGRNAFLFPDATFGNLEAVLSDKVIKNVIIIGHASYGSWVASDKSVSWLDVSRMARDHIKEGYFAKSGCNQKQISVPWTESTHFKGHIPFAYFAVTDKSKIYVSKKEMVDTSELASPIELISLDKHDITLKEELKSEKPFSFFERMFGALSFMQ